MKNRDLKMRLRYQEKEDDRLRKMADKQIKKDKAKWLKEIENLREEYSETTDKQRFEEEAFCKLHELKERLDDIKRVKR